jgi:hypothetical protein
VGWRSFTKAIAKPGRKIAFAAHRLRYDLASAEEEQNSLFSEWSLSRRDGLAAVERVLAAHPELSGSMQSEHYVLFGAISESRKPKRILEIGTFDGRGAGVLAALFPAARIDTLDLPDDHAAFKESYKRKDAAVRLNFIRKRDEFAPARIGVRLRIEPLMDEREARQSRFGERIQRVIGAGGRVHAIRVVAITRGIFRDVVAHDQPAGIQQPKSIDDVDRDRRIAVVAVNPDEIVVLPRGIAERDRI